MLETTANSIIIECKLKVAAEPASGSWKYASGEALNRSAVPALKSSRRVSGLFSTSVSLLTTQMPNRWRCRDQINWGYGISYCETEKEFLNQRCFQLTKSILSILQIEIVKNAFTRKPTRQRLLGHRRKVFSLQG